MSSSLPLSLKKQDSFDPFGVFEPEQPITPEIVTVFRTMPEVASVTPVLNLPSTIEISLSYEDQALPIRLSGDFGHSSGAQAFHL